MNEDKKMFWWGCWLVISVMVLTVILQVCYRIQNRARNKIRTEIVKVQQETAVSAANFASFVRPEILRNVVVSLYPKAEVISFNKSVSIDELPGQE